LVPKVATFIFETLRTIGEFATNKM